MSAIRPNKNFENERMVVKPKAIITTPPRPSIKAPALEKWFRYSVNEEETELNQNKDEPRR